MKTRAHVFYSGRVQGVGFRYTVDRLAHKHPVTGFVQNLADGRVELLAEGEEQAISALLDDIDRIMGGYIDDRLTTTEDFTGEFDRFRVASGRI